MQSTTCIYVAVNLLLSYKDTNTELALSKGLLKLEDYQEQLSSWERLVHEVYMPMRRAIQDRESITCRESRAIRCAGLDLLFTQFLPISKLKNELDKNKPRKRL